MSLDFTSDLDFPPAKPTAEAQPSEASAAADDAGLLQFDLSSLNLDLAPSETSTTTDAPASADPLATKLALAEEFHAIGDTEGARSLVEEVIAEATGPLKTKAEQLLGQLT